MIDPWGEGTPWKTQSQFFTYLRGCLRKAWVRNPIKLNLIKKKRKQIPNPNPKGNKPTVWGFTCELCGNDFVLKDGQVDHKIPAGQLSKKEDIQGFVERLLWVTEDSLRLICKDCHGIITLSDRKGISFEEAKIEKQIIAFKKLKSAEQLKFMQGLGLQTKPTSKARIEEYRKYLNGL